MWFSVFESIYYLIILLITRCGGYDYYKYYLLRRWIINQSHQFLALKIYMFYPFFPYEEGSWHILYNFYCVVFLKIILQQVIICNTQSRDDCNGPSLSVLTTTEYCRVLVTINLRKRSIYVTKRETKFEFYFGADGKLPVKIKRKIREMIESV